MKKTRSLLAVLACLALLVSLCAVSVSAAETKTVTSSVDFSALTGYDEITSTAAGDVEATKAVLESMGLIIPDRIGWEEDPAADANHAWVLMKCIEVELTPRNGFEKCAYIQKLEVGEGKTLLTDATLDIGYWLSCSNPDWEPSFIAVDVSVDGENWVEVATDDESNGAEWDASAKGEVKGLTLPGTAGASTVYVKIVVEAHGGPTAGGVAYSTINGTVEADAGDVGTDTPPTGDMIVTVVAMLVVSGVGITVLKKKEN